MTGFSPIGTVRLLLWAGALLALSACGGHYRHGPPSWPAPVLPTSPQAVPPRVEASAVALELLTVKGPRSGAVLIKRAAADERAATDVLLFEMGLILLSGDTPDPATAQVLLERLVADHPASERRQAASAILGLLDRSRELKKGNVALREKLNRILSIDLETERQRQTTTP